MSRRLIHEVLFISTCPKYCDFIVILILKPILQLLYLTIYSIV
jgi:hypothetical protein